MVTNLHLRWCGACGASRPAQPSNSDNSGGKRSNQPRYFKVPRRRTNETLFCTRACSLSPHIVLREVGASFDLEQVDNRQKKTKSGADFWTINPKGYVPVLELDTGARLTEGPAIVQYIADMNPAAGLVPPAGSMERYRVMEWLNFVTSELHKSFGPMFNPATPDTYKAILRENIGRRFDWLEKQVSDKQYLMGDKFTVADAYLFTVARWSPFVEIDLAKWPNLKAYLERVEARPKVQEAMKAEGLLKAA
jgi:glutathione S-transferase